MTDIVDLLPSDVMQDTDRILLYRKVNSRWRPFDFDLASLIKTIQFYGLGFTSGAVTPTQTFDGVEGSLALDFSDSSSAAMIVYLVGDTTINITTPTALQYSLLTLILVQPDEGGCEVTFEGGITWIGGEAPQVTDTSNNMDIIKLAYIGDGKTIIGGE